VDQRVAGANVHGRPSARADLPDWFYAGVLDEALVLTIDRAYFDLTGGLERWLYRLVRKQPASGGSSTSEFRTSAKSAASRSAAFELRAIVRRQLCPALTLSPFGRRTPHLQTRRLPAPRGLASSPGISCESSRAIRDRNHCIGNRFLVLSGTRIV
jgi:hypothetical protein